MKRLPLGILLLTNLHAEWGFDVLKKGAELYDETREKTIQIYRQTFQTLSPETPDEAIRNQKQMAEAWEQVVDDLKEGTHYIDQMKEVPDSAWIVRDKTDVQEDIDQLFSRIIKGLVGEDLEVLQEKIHAYKEQIEENQQKILLYREKRIAAPFSSMLHTTKAAYDRKIEALQEENRIVENEIRMLKEKLRRRFTDIGVKLSLEQIDVLLTRVDGDDIIRIAMVMDTLKYITMQIQKLMQESHEELKQAKRYYGMHQVLLELVVYIQQQYIDKCNHEYIPKVEKIIIQAEAMIKHTNALRNVEEDSQRAKVYANNIEALKWTLEVARRYKADLIAARDRMKEAQHVARANLRLSQNTYETVSLSSDLYALIAQSQEMFIQVSRIQVPSIVPFRNIKIKQKYREITQKIR